MAGHLALGQSVGWFQGRMEAGPRALGQRSILAAHHTSARDHINRHVKHREQWRPLAPVMLEEAAPTLIGTSSPHPFMIVARPATDAARDLIPAAVHTDGTLRPQAVTHNDADLYARMLASFAEQTARPPALLNTSFNHEAEPIVCTPPRCCRHLRREPAGRAGHWAVPHSQDPARLTVRTCPLTPGTVLVRPRPSSASNEQDPN